MSQNQFSDSFFQELDKKILVSKIPYPHASIKNFLPSQLCKKVSNDFKFPEIDPNAGIEDKVFQKTKKGLTKIDLMPYSIQNLINNLNSKKFLSKKEKKFEIQNQSQIQLYLRGMHESFKGGFLKIHSDLFL